METISSAKNPLVQRLRALRERKGRTEQGRILVEGEVMLREALSCGLIPREGLAAEGHEALAAQLQAAGAHMALAPERLLESVCDTRTPQGICAAFDAPAPMELDALPERIVALDGVQDPGNVGTIWRTADAAGFLALLAGPGTADLNSPKVQRAAMGSGFRIPYALAGDLPEALRTLKARGFTCVAADLRGEPFARRPRLTGPLILMIGNEANGLSPQALALADVRLKLPMRGGAESLNAAVAAGIFMYGLTDN